MTMNLIAIQTEYIETVNAGKARWSHRPNGGHASRITRGAHTLATKRLKALGFDEAAIKPIMRDANDMAKLERICDED